MDNLLSSPMGGEYKRSQFSYRHLMQMKQYHVESPLRVIAHIDLDAFYAQCEMVRLNVDENQPLAVQQWSGLIAVNYPARKFGITRFLKLEEAMKLCPNLMCVHVATWRVGADKAVCDYHPQTATSISTDKVSLDHYRRESKKIFSIFRAKCDRVEKAGIDEGFVDLSRMVYDKLLERYADELGVVDGVPIAPYADLTEKLRLPEVGTINWNESHLVDLDEGNDAEEEPIDWDDIVMSIGAEIVLEVRLKIKSELNYTCSAGLARNKMLAKLGSAYKKPMQQTIVRNRAVGEFLGSMKFQKIRNLGGKLGEKVAGHFSTELLSDLLPIPLETFKKKLDDDTGTWLYHTIRGIDKNEVNPRTDIKSMLSAKSFRPDVNKREEGEAWLKVFCADIVNRINELSDEPDPTLSSQPIILRRPKTMTLHHRHGQNNKTRQAPIPVGKPIEADFLLGIAKNLLKQIEAEGRCWPCQNLSLAVGGFDDIGRGNNRGIGGWVVRGDEAKVVIEENSKRMHGLENVQDSPKKRKAKGNIQRFFANNEENERTRINFDRNSSLDEVPNDDDDLYMYESNPQYDAKKQKAFQQPDIEIIEASRSPSRVNTSSFVPPPLRKDSSGRKRFFSKEPTPFAEPELLPVMASAPEPEPSFPCPDCNNKMIPISAFDEHSDWHYARSVLRADKKPEIITIGGEVLQQNNHNEQAVKQPVKTIGKGRGRPKGSLNKPKGINVTARPATPSNNDRTDKGQMKLPFSR